jgi:hypothetical protein
MRTQWIFPFPTAFHIVYATLEVRKHRNSISSSPVVCLGCCPPLKQHIMKPGAFVKRNLFVGSLCILCQCPSQRMPHRCNVHMGMSSTHRMVIAWACWKPLYCYLLPPMTVVASVNTSARSLVPHSHSDYPDGQTLWHVCHSSLCLRIEFLESDSESVVRLSRSACLQCDAESQLMFRSAHEFDESALSAGLSPQAKYRALPPSPYLLRILCKAIAGLKDVVWWKLEVLLPTSWLILVFDDYRCTHKDNSDTTLQRSARGSELRLHAFIACIHIRAQA